MRMTLRSKNLHPRTRKDTFVYWTSLLWPEGQMQTPTRRCCCSHRSAQTCQRGQCTCTLFYWIHSRGASKPKGWEDMEIYAFGTARASDLYVREKFIMAAAPPVCSVSFPRPWGFAGKIHSQSTHAAPKKKRGNKNSVWSLAEREFLVKNWERNEKKNYSRFTTRTYDPSGTSASSNLVDQRGAEKKRTLSAITAGSSILIHHSLRPAAASTRLILTAGPSTAGSSGAIVLWF